MIKVDPLFSVSSFMIDQVSKTDGFLGESGLSILLLCCGRFKSVTKGVFECWLTITNDSNI